MLHLIIVFIRIHRQYKKNITEKLYEEIDEIIK